jgi:acetyltransferase-like isoleucine patch superfamily enzyme
MKLLSYRNLGEEGGPEFSENQVKAIASSFEVTDGPNSDGEMFTRPAKPSDNFVKPYQNVQEAMVSAERVFGLLDSQPTVDEVTDAVELPEIYGHVKFENVASLEVSDDTANRDVVIGEDSAIAASTAIAGSTVIGKRCMIGGMVGIIGHINICDDVIIGGKSIVDKNIKAPGMYTGVMPLMPHRQWKKVGLWITKLDKIIKYLNIKLKKLKD